MNTGGEVAGVMANLYLELAKRGVDLSSKMISYILLAILKGIEGNLNTGQISMKKMLESGDPLKQIKMNEKDGLSFVSKANKAGLTFAVLNKTPDKDGNLTYFFKEKDMEVVEALLKSMHSDRTNGIEEKVDKSILDEFVLAGGSREVYIADKNNPENYIATFIQQAEIEKGYIVNPKNPDEYIFFNENIKANTLAVEINNGKDVIKTDTSKNEHNDIKNKIIAETERWGSCEIVFTEEERLKLKEKVKEEKEKEKKDDKDDKKTMQEVEREVKNMRNNQPCENKEAKTKSTKEKAR